MTAEDLHLVVAEATSAGVLEENERAIISGVVRLADRPTREVMTPRTEVDWIDVDADAEALREPAGHAAQPASGRRRLGRPVGRRRPGARHRHRPARRRPLDLRALMRPVPVVPDQMDAMNALNVLRAAEVPIAFVHDEYGHFDGIVTPVDLLAALAGEFVSDQDPDTDPPLVEREDGSWWVSGSVSADTLSDRLGIELPEDRDYLDRGRLRAFRAEAPAGSRRAVHLSRLAVRDRRHGRPQDRQAAGVRGPAPPSRRVRS